jgi:phage terminase large subunit GpA-like protein
MAMAAGAKLGPYQILAPIGAGGMGEVYRARDAKLKRDVALKVLPEVFASDAERLARFQREAEVLASLNHPNIAHIYGVEGAGSWRATSVCEPDTRGYHLSQLYSPWTSWRDLLRRAEAARGVPEKERVFFNCGLGLTWAPPALETPPPEALMARAEPFAEGTVPAGACFLTAGCDIQADRIEIEIVGWGRNFESWSVHYLVLYGDITEPAVWSRLDSLLTRSWPHASGMPLQLQAVAVDCGFSTSEVAEFCRHRHGARIYATKGLSNGWGKPIWPRRASWSRKKDALYLISSDEAKLWVANRLKIDKPGAGYLHFPLSRERSWYEQLIAERLVYAKGQRKWTNTARARNEAGDCRALAVAALHSRLLAGLDLNEWCRQFDAMLAPQPAAAPVNGPPASPNVTRSKWMSY